MTSRIRNLGMKTRRTSYRTALGSLKHFVSEFSAIFPDGPEVQRPELCLIPGSEAQSVIVVLFVLSVEFRERAKKNLHAPAPCDKLDLKEKYKTSATVDSE